MQLLCTSLRGWEGETQDFWSRFLLLCLIFMLRNRDLLFYKKREMQELSTGVVSTDKKSRKCYQFIFYASLHWNMIDGATTTLYGNYYKEIWICASVAQKKYIEIDKRCMVVYVFIANAKGKKSSGFFCTPAEAPEALVFPTWRMALRGLYDNITLKN